MKNNIDRYFKREDWPSARKAIIDLLHAAPSDHWLLTRLGSTYYEEHKYKVSFRYFKRALALSPHCPLVLCDYAGCTAMLGQVDEAISVYKRVVRRGVNAIAKGECGEGIIRARGLVADCHYMLGLLYHRVGKDHIAVSHLKKHLALRKQRCDSIYPVKEVREELWKLTK